MGWRGLLPYLRLSGAGRVPLRPGAPRGRARPGGGTQVAAPGRDRPRAGLPAAPGQQGGPEPAAAPRSVGAGRSPQAQHVATGTA
ncbi:translation initiation factor IF-2-like [Motacilla alba alba]|uniref:translation initiation factor IF-2-like n=1 Tax=Motacilla alba alba TaxID=1094192 RepID=UPI0018D4E820|nr:translation initiation factor IF-2-like [Motacilla alba alba]